MNTVTDILAGFTYVELIDLLGQLNQHYPDHELLPWVEQEIELRDEEMRWLAEQMYVYGETHRAETNWE